MSTEKQIEVRAPFSLEGDTTIQTISFVDKDGVFMYLIHTKNAPQRLASVLYDHELYPDDSFPEGQRDKGESGILAFLNQNRV